MKRYFLVTVKIISLINFYGEVIAILDNGFYLRIIKVKPK